MGNVFMKFASRAHPAAIAIATAICVVALAKYKPDDALTMGMIGMMSAFWATIITETARNNNEKSGGD